MARQIVVGIDIGTSQIKVIVAEGFFNQGRFAPKIIGTGLAETRGLSRGYIADTGEATHSVRLAVSRAEKMSGIKIKRAYVSFGGIGLSSVTTTGSIAISRADLEITERDLALVLESAEKAIPQPLSMNKKIINTIPIEYKTDNKVVWGQAVGLKAHKLEVKALFITCLEHHLKDLITTMEEAGVEVVDIVASPIASSFIALSKKQKRVGCLLTDFGAETLSMVAFENGSPISLEVFPTGGNDITNDIALALKIPLEEAEKIKMNDSSRAAYSKKKLDEVIITRVKESFELVETHLKKINRNALLPAGVVITGGGANLSNIKNVVEDVLELPVQVAEFHFGESESSKIKDSTWAIACGLTIVGFNSDNEQNIAGSRDGSLMSMDGKRWGKAIVRWVQQLLP
ncbi:MAG: cell division protein FtsA [Parcubacteria group bacterium]